jgi:hypothetical protein
VPATAGLLVAPATQAQYASILATVQRCTDPGAPIFVYPSAPLVYVVAQRPNPTRLAHLYPGAASPSELAGVIASLERNDVSLVLVSDFWLGFWGPRDGQNAPLEAYVNTGFHELANEHGVHVLVRGPRC